MILCFAVFALLCRGSGLRGAGGGARWTRLALGWLGSSCRLAGGSCGSSLLLVALTHAIALTHTPHKALDLSCCVYDALLTSVERVAGAANVYAQILLGAARLPRIATRAGNSGHLILWVNALLHGSASIDRLLVWASVIPLDYVF
jgi:hypothetical protein